MRTIDELQAYKAKAKRQRDNWKRRAEVYRVALEDIAAGPCCGCCSDDDPQCDVGRAKDALRAANATAHVRAVASNVQQIVGTEVNHAEL